LTTTLQPTLSQSFSRCTQHYVIIANLLWSTFAIHIILSIIKYIWQTVQEDFKKTQTKVPKILAVINILTCVSLISAAAALYAQGNVCSQVPSTQLGSLGVELFILPGCQLKSGVDLEGALQAAVQTALVVISSKPVQAVLYLFGLITLPSPADMLSGLI